MKPSRGSGRRTRLRGWVRDAVVMAAVLALMAALGFGFAEAVEKGRPRRREMVREIERTFLDVVEASIRAGNVVIDEPAVADLTSKMMSRLSSGLAAMEGRDGDPAPEILVLVVDSPAVNAAALPGGIVVLYSGLIRAVEGPGQLAGVLAHELGHCVNNDVRNAFIREVGISVLLGSSGAGRASEVAGEMIRGAVRLRYGRRAEKRADRFAVDLLAASGLEPGEFAGALASLTESSERMPDWVRYTDVHRPLDERIAAAKERSDRIDSESLGSRRRGLEVDWEAVLNALPSESGDLMEDAGAGESASGPER